MIARVVLLLSVLAIIPASRASAAAKFVIRAQGDVFDDPTPVSPEGGNPGATLGAQRKALVEYVAGVLGAQLDSPIPIVVEVMARKYPCDGNSVVLAGARPYDAFGGIRTLGADPELWYPSALADRLAGRDLAPGDPDIKVYINRSVDEECRTRFGGFYYGFDAKSGDTRQDLAETLLHEFAHGLGFASAIDLDTGVPNEGGIDVFSAQIFDLAARRSWRAMSNLERQVSARNVRGLSFAGANTTRAAASLLARGSPRLELTPALAGFVGAVAETGAGYPGFEGPVRLAGSFEGCASPSTGLSGSLVLIRPDCMVSGVLLPRLAAAGVAGVLLVPPSDYSQPALPITLMGGVGPIPSLVVSGADAELMRGALAAGTLRARAQWDTTRLVGADVDGRLLLFASQPADESSSVSHFEPLARPDLLMEPFSRRNATRDLDLTLSVLQDLGWAELCGNRRLDLGEECDEGDANSDSAPGACRKRCVRASCGDGVVDQGEACDQGEANSDSTPNGCRLACQKARCGDGVLDSGESCDRGMANSDALPDACRKDCRLARCGDGVVDAAERCDGSPGCTPTCALAPPMIVAPEPVIKPEPSEPVEEPVAEQKSDGSKPVWQDLPDDEPANKRRAESDCSLPPGPATSGARPALALSGLLIALARRRAGRRS